ncbi:MAG: MFS transporter [Gammaproteobacteria bacterium]|nr:MFS transporter [Gammaproteobacteria bacterium]
MRNKWGGIGDAFADRNFRVYTVGSVTSWISFYVQWVAISWVTWELTHSTTWLAIMALLDIAPNLFFVPLGGALADRYDRFRIVAVTHVIALLQALALAVLAYLDALTIWPLAVLVFLHGLIHSFSVPALYGMLPRYVERKRLSSAIAVNSAYTQAAIFAGPALAGWLIARHGAALAFAVNALGYAVYLGSIALLKTPADYQPQTKTDRSIVGDLVDGMRYIGGHSGIATLLALILLGDAMSASVYYMLPAYAEKTLGLAVGGMSTLLTVAGLGATLAALWLAHGGAARATSSSVLWAFFIFMLSIAGLALVDSLVPAIVAMIVFGIAGEIRRTGTLSLIQMSIPDDRRGRVLGTHFMLSRIAGGIGTYLIGASADRHGLSLPLLTAVTVCLIAWALTFSKRERIATAFTADSQTL